MTATANADGGRQMADGGPRTAAGGWRTPDRPRPLTHPHNHPYTPYTPYTLAFDCRRFMSLGPRSKLL